MTLTKNDKDWIEGTLKDVIQDQEGKFETKMVEVKSDFYEKIDPILKEVVENQEELAILSHRVFVHEDKIENIEKKSNIQAAI